MISTVLVCKHHLRDIEKGERNRYVRKSIMSNRKRFADLLRRREKEKERKKKLQCRQSEKKLEEEI